MAIHTSLPIYKVAYDLLRTVTPITKNFPRDYKVSIGGQIRDECVAVMLLVCRANTAVDKGKVPHLTALIECVHTVEIFIRLSLDMKLISREQYAKIILITDQVGKQAGGWKRKFAPVPPPSPVA